MARTVAGSGHEAALGGAMPLAEALALSLPISAGAGIFVLGDAFAGALHRGLAACGRSVEAEPPPDGFPPAVLKDFGWGQGAARTGPLRSAREVAQLLAELSGRRAPRAAIREIAPGQFIDSLRPGVEPAGFDSHAAAIEARAAHLAAISKALTSAEVVLLCLSSATCHEDPAHRSAHPPEAAARIGGLVPARSTLSQIESELSSIWRDLRQLMDEPRLIMALSPAVEDGWPDGARDRANLRIAMSRLATRGRRLAYLPLHEVLTAPGRLQDCLAPDGRPTRAGLAEALHLVCGTAPLGLPQGGTASVPDSRTEGDGAESDDPLVCEELLYEAFAPGGRA
ncbi:GSCFA domain-containing protein [Frigidibacter sp. MR17.14]|uniref:GSCFA domain-containing protein n=1 Tax=Frigidibacter sp. MR17.14 TaxID=3126509 RepID=UPI003012FA19